MVLCVINIVILITVLSIHLISYITPELFSYPGNYTLEIFVYLMPYIFSFPLFIMLFDFRNYMEMNGFKEWLKDVGLTFNEGKKNSIPYEYYFDEGLDNKSIPFKVIIDVFGY